MPSIADAPPGAGACRSLSPSLRFAWSMPAPAATWLTRAAPVCARTRTQRCRGAQRKSWRRDWQQWKPPKMTCPDSTKRFSGSFAGLLSRWRKSTRTRADKGCKHHPREREREHMRRAHPAALATRPCALTALQKRLESCPSGCTPTLLYIYSYTYLYSTTLTADGRQSPRTSVDEWRHLLGTVHPDPRRGLAVDRGSHG